MSRRWRLLAGLLVLTLCGCGPGEPPPPVPAPAPAPAVAPLPGIGTGILPEVPARLPPEAREADGSMAPWALPAQVGATLQALAEACGQEDSDQIRRMHGEQRAALEAGGVDLARFETVWDWAYRQARQKIALQPSADLEQGCAGLERMQEDAARMGALRAMALP